MLGAALASLVLAGCAAVAYAPAPAAAVRPAPSRARAQIDLSDWNNPALWARQNGYSNGGDFNVGWRAANATVAHGVLNITLDDRGCPTGCSRRPFASDELDSVATYRYGTYTVRMQAARGSGIVSTFFTYVNLTPGGPETNDEIDVEIPGARTRTLEATYYKEGGPGIEHTIALPFDAASAMHTYAIRWLPDSISWIVDGRTLYTRHGSPATLPTHPSAFILNFWTGSTPGIVSWLGPFHYRHPLHARYALARFTPAR